MKALLAGIALALVVAPAGAAQADVPPAPPATATYDEAIRCQAFYVVYAGLLDQGSDDYQDAADVFDEWYDFTARHYPDTDGHDHDADLKAGIDQVDTELGKAADEDAAQAIMGGYLDDCALTDPVSA